MLIFRLPAVASGCFALLISLSVDAKPQTEGSPEESNAQFSLELAAGYEYDSNVSIDEIDTNTSKGDHAAVAELDLGLKLPIGTTTDLDLGYGISQSLHQDFGEFDLQTHLASADLSHDFGDFDAGFTGRYVSARLDGSDFLRMQQFSPHFSRFFGKKLYLRADYTYTDKHFHTIADRDAETHAAGADLYWFLRGIRSYLVFGYRLHGENADAAEYDYRSHTVKLRYVRRFKLGTRNITAKLGWRYQARDYRAVTPLIGKDRDDDRYRIDFNVEIPLRGKWFVSFEHDYADNSSNLPSADYSQRVTSLKLHYRL